MNTEELIKLLQQTKSDNVVIDIVVDGGGEHFDNQFSVHFNSETNTTELQVELPANHNL